MTLSCDQCCGNTGQAHALLEVQSTELQAKQVIAHWLSIKRHISMDSLEF